MTGPAHNLPLVGALTALSWANHEAAEQAKTQRVADILLATARAADEAARLVQHNLLDRLTPQQLKMIEDVQS